MSRSSDPEIQVTSGVSGPRHCFTGADCRILDFELVSSGCTHWGFFPLWLGYCLTVDALTYYRTGTSLWTRSGCINTSAFSWFCRFGGFEAINWRLANWHYNAGEFSAFPVLVLGDDQLHHGYLGRLYTTELVAASIFIVASPDLSSGLLVSFTLAFFLAGLSRSG